MSESYPVAPQCVYVWRGFKPAATRYEDFVAFLSTVFVPACVLLQPNVGLRAYLPTLVPQEGKPDAVPDQTALMFWNGPEAHDIAKNAIAVRIYSDLHGDVYDMERSSTGPQEKPVLFDASVAALTAEQPYFLIQQSADWMHGTTHHLVCARPSAMETAKFLQLAAAWAKTLQINRLPDVDGVLVCAGTGYLAVWVHSTKETISLDAVVRELAEQTQIVLKTDAVKHSLQAKLWDNWPGGLDLTIAPCLNLQFARPDQTEPRQRGAHAAD